MPERPSQGVSPLGVFIASTGAGLIEGVTVQPFDYVKTVMQTQGTTMSATVRTVGLLDKGPRGETFFLTVSRPVGHISMAVDRLMVTIIMTYF